MYNAIAKYAGLLINLIISGVLARLLTPDDFGIVAVATVIITFFSIFSDLGIAPAIIQYKNLDQKDLSNIFSFSLWTGLLLAGIFFGASWLIADYYSSPILLGICQMLSINLFFAAINIVPNALLYKEKRFQFIAIRTVVVQLVCGVIAVAAALCGLGVYALLINPIGSSILLFIISYRQYPQKIRRTWGIESIRKIFSFSMYQFFFNVINYFSRNLDKLLTGKYLGMEQLGYYDKSYRLMMLPLGNITNVITPVMHPVFSDLQNDLRKLSDNYVKIVRILAYIGFPLSAFLYFGAREIMLIVFGPQWEASVPVFQILALSVGVQIILSTSGSIFQAANATRVMFLSGIYSTILNVTGILIGIFVFRSIEAIAWCICTTFTINFIMSYYLMYYITFRFSWRPFWRQLVKPLLLTAILAAILYLQQVVYPISQLIGSLILKSGLSFGTWFAFIQLSGEFNLIHKLREWNHRKKQIVPPSLHDTKQMN